MLHSVVVRLCACQVKAEVDLIGFDAGAVPVNAKNEPSVGLRAFMRRAVKTAEARVSGNMAQGLAAIPADNRSAMSGTVNDLVRSIREEDCKVHIDLHARIPKITLKNLHSWCYPSSDATDKLAQLKEKACCCFCLACFRVLVLHVCVCRPFARKSRPLFRLRKWLSSCRAGRRMLSWTIQLRTRTRQKSKSALGLT